MSFSFREDADTARAISASLQEQVITPTTPINAVNVQSDQDFPSLGGAPAPPTTITDTKKMAAAARIVSGMTMRDDDEQDFPSLAGRAPTAVPNRVCTTYCCPQPVCTI